MSLSWVICISGQAIRQACIINKAQAITQTVGSIHQEEDTNNTYCRAQHLYYELRLHALNYGSW